MRWPHYIKNAYSNAESFSHWEHFLKTTASLSNLRLFNLKRILLHLAGPRSGRKVLARSRCSPTNTTVKKRYMCYVSSSFPTRNKMSNWMVLFFNLCEDFHISPKTHSVCPVGVFCSRQMSKCTSIDWKDLKCVVVVRRRRPSSSSVPIEFPRKYIK